MMLVAVDVPVTVVMVPLDVLVPLDVPMPVAVAVAVNGNAARPDVDVLRQGVSRGQDQRRGGDEDGEGKLHVFGSVSKVVATRTSQASEPIRKLWRSTRS